MIQEFLKDLFSKIDPNDSHRVGIAKFLLFMAILTIPTGFISFLANYETPGRGAYPYADIDRFGKEADFLRKEYRALYEDIQQCALHSLSNGTYTPYDYMYDIRTVMKLDEMYRNISFGDISFDFASSLRASYPEFFDRRNPHCEDFGKASAEIEQTQKIGHSKSEPFSWKPFLEWLHDWYFGAFPFVLFMCLILSWQGRIVFSLKSPFVSLLYFFLWPINFFIRTRRRVLDIDRETRLRLTKNGFFTKLSEKEKHFLETYSSFTSKSNDVKESWNEEHLQMRNEMMERLQNVSRFNLRYVILILFVSLTRFSGLTLALYEKDFLNQSFQTIIIQPPEFDSGYGYLDDCCTFGLFDTYMDIIVVIQKIKLSLYKTLLLSKGYIQQLLKVPLEVNTFYKN